jgi:HAD superfamily hydrolase (TIGR01509 family)
MEIALERTKTSKAQKPTLLFDLDGTLIDSVYQHVISWREALEEAGIQASNAPIHRRIGMSGKLIARSFLRENGREAKPEDIERITKLQSDAYLKRIRDVRPLPGASKLLSTLSKLEVPFAIGTSSKREHAQPPLDMLGLPRGTTVVTGDEVQSAKPAPDLFLACANRLGVEIKDCMVVGDSTWDILAAQRARALGIGLLSGGFGEEELLRAGAYQVYKDPADLLERLDEIGIETE